MCFKDSNFLSNRVPAKLSVYSLYHLVKSSIIQSYWLRSPTSFDTQPALISIAPNQVLSSRYPSPFSSSSGVFLFCVFLLAFSPKFILVVSHHPFSIRFVFISSGIVRCTPIISRILLFVSRFILDLSAARSQKYISVASSVRTVFSFSCHRLLCF